MDKPTNDRFYRFLLVIRQACLMIAGWVESETNTKGTATSAMRSITHPDDAPLQFRSLTDEELDAISDRIERKIMRSLDSAGR